MSASRKGSLCSWAVILGCFVCVALCVNGCLSIFEWNSFAYDWDRNGSVMSITVVGDLHMKGAPDSTNWIGNRYAWEAFEFPSSWSGDSLVSTVYQLYKVKTSGDSLMRTGTLSWSHSALVAEKAQAVQPAKEGNAYRGFVSNEAIPWDRISAFVGSEYRIHYTTLLTISGAPDVGYHRCSQILGDEMDGLWSGRSFMVDGDPSDIPTLTQWGVTALVALLIGSAIFIMLRRRKEAAAA
jgi:hypothetical protein